MQRAAVGGEMAMVAVEASIQDIPKVLNRIQGWVTGHMRLASSCPGGNPRPTVRVAHASMWHWVQPSKANPPPSLKLVSRLAHLLVSVILLMREHMWAHVDAGPSRHAQSRFQTVPSPTGGTVAALGCSDGVYYFHY